MNQMAQQPQIHQMQQPPHHTMHQQPHQQQQQQYHMQQQQQQQPHYHMNQQQTQPQYHMNQQQQQQQPQYHMNQQNFQPQYATPPQLPPQPTFVPTTMNTSSVPPSQPPSTPSNPTSAASRWQMVRSCFSVDSYLMYFDIDTADIQKRIYFSLIFFYMPDKFRCEVIGVERTDQLKGADLYGPIWISMTLVFFFAVTSNLSAYFRASNLEEFEYDVTHVVNAMYIIYSFSFGVPAVWWCVTQCLGLSTPLKLMDWICLYGYSLVSYFPATILCLFPFHIWIWFVLMVATIFSCLLVVRNVAGPLLGADPNKSGSLLIGILVSHFIFLLVLKFKFYE
eukprot:CAMPEP_0202456644 /NCGR_PEP_ID=MMETSP1360-20130828/13852_1 /ASSEMBLY_ACC=CAM_ASM_000848 /TAXON_ID=515479 /ORGANISM="Licmophora paradoxa, Strain CCMP2313" /LENGTH=335 /DNA_ID=CAMNT_0049076515 /DNA_START=1 /DNA_END=1008 /DNA_ORIENTATION=-